MAANPHNGECDITLGSQSYTVRLTMEQLESIEIDLTKRLGLTQPYSVLDLTQRLQHRSASILEMNTVLRVALAGVPGLTPALITALLVEAELVELYLAAIQTLYAGLGFLRENAGEKPVDPLSKTEQAARPVSTSASTDGLH